MTPVSVRLTAADHAEFKRLARRMGLTLSEFMRLSARRMAALSPEPQPATWTSDPPTAASGHKVRIHLVGVA